MKKSRCREEQIIGVLEQHEAGVKTAELCREHGISGARFYQWKSKFGGMEVSEAQRLKQVEDENRRLQLLVAELSLHGEALKAVIRKNGWSLAELRTESRSSRRSTGSANARPASCWAWSGPAIDTSLRAKAGAQTQRCVRIW